MQRHAAGSPQRNALATPMVYTDEGAASPDSATLGPALALGAGRWVDFGSGLVYDFCKKYLAHL